MAKADLTKFKVKTHPFRVSYPHVFEPQEQDSGDPRYSLTMLYDKKLKLNSPAVEGTNGIMDACLNAGAELYGSRDRSKWPKNHSWPITDGDEDDKHEDSEECKGKIVIRCSTKKRPDIVDQQLNRIDETRASDFYAGCIARASLIASSYEIRKKDKKTGKESVIKHGVMLVLLNLQKLGDAKPFTGRKSAAQEFEEVEDQSDYSEMDEVDQSTDDDSESDGGW